MAAQMAAHDETARQRLEESLTRLWQRSRFTSYFFQSVDLIEEPEIPTLALLIMKARLVLYYSGPFIRRLSSEEIIGLLVHEMMHVIMNHDHRAFHDEDIYLQNLAQDMVINSHLTRNRKTFFSRRDQYSEDVAAVILPGGLPTVPAAFIAESGRSDPAWEALYHWLRDLPADELKSIRRSSEHRDAPANLPLSSEETTRAYLDDALQNPLNIPDAYRTPETYVTVGDQRGLAFMDTAGRQLPTGVHMMMSRESMQQLRAKKEGLIRFAAGDARCLEERTFQQIHGIISDVRKQETASWTRRIKSLVDHTSHTGNWKYTHGRFNRRYFAQGIYAAGRVFEDKHRLVVAVDVSGSVVMQPEMLESAFGVVDDLTRKYTVHLVCIDEQLFVPETSDRRVLRSKTADQSYTYKRGDWKQIKTGSMGTTFFSPLFNGYMRNRRETLLVITDGEIYDLDKLAPYQPTLWLVPESNRHRFTEPFGQVIAMPS